MARQITIAALLALAAGGAQAAMPALTTDHLVVADIDGDGAVDEMTSNAFILMDGDNDNKLSPTEAAAIPADLLKKMDADADGLGIRAEYDSQILVDFDAANLNGDGPLN